MSGRFVFVDDALRDRAVKSGCGSIVSGFGRRLVAALNRRYCLFNGGSHR